MLSLLMIVSFIFVGCKDPEIPQESTGGTGGTESPEKPGDTNKPEATYTVKFYYSDESSAGKDVTGKKVGEVVTLPTISEKANKTFSGWYLTKTATGNAVSSSLSGGKYTVKAADAKEGIIKLYAVYIENSSAIEVVSISVSPSTVSSLQVGSTQQLTVSYNPVDANVGNSVTYVSDATNVATVDGNGLVKAVSAGNAVITVTSANGKSTTVNVTVVPKPKVLLSVELGKTNDTTFTATAKYDDSTTEEVTNTSSWASTNTSVATVNNGVVEVVGEGTTEISASYTYNGVTKETGSAKIVSKANLSSGNVLVVYMLSNYSQVQNGVGHIYGWKGASEPWGKWPGTAMTTLTSDGAAYYFVIEDTTNIESLIINNNDKEQTKNMPLPASSGHWLCWHDGSDWGWKEYDGVLADVGGNDNPSDGTFNVTVTMPGVQNPDNPVIPDDPVIPNGLYIYVKAASTPTIWAWEANSGEALSENLGESWPGNAMSAAIGMNDPTGWYMKDFTEAGATGKNIVFKLNGGASEITGLNKTFWYDGTQCYDTDPTTPPEPTAPRVTVSPSNGATLGLNDSITVSFNAGNDISNFEASITIAGRTYTYGTDFNSLSKSFNVSSDLGIDSSTTVSVFAECSNSIGSDNFNGSYTVDETKKTDTFTWDNALVYFVLTDRFYNGSTANDYSYYRQNASKGFSGPNVATFHGGDIVGMTQKLDYLDDLGVNAIWITAPYEQIHGWVSGKNDKFPHFSFHGYYAQDWTFMDQNIGTIEEFRTFVNEAHKRGIRIVMDVVMNHTGYNTYEDMITYEFGGYSETTHGWLAATNGTWQANAKVTDWTTPWSKWWGCWVRAFDGNYGYAAMGGGDLTGQLAGLPDVVTESTTKVSIPTFLRKKWNSELNKTSTVGAGNTTGNKYVDYQLPSISNVDWYNKSGDWRADSKGAPADYLIMWLSAWVREFGIDGFRCDTAKHVDMYRWGQLKDACQSALEAWRNDSTKEDTAGAKSWDESFWMTGECFGWSSTAGQGDYYTTGKFDSMINFSFNASQWGGSGSSGSTPTADTWNSYLSINNNSDSDGNGNRNNALSYVSSHDTGLHRPGNQINLGTMLCLLPGGVQIYYGDESSRPAVDAFGDTDMATRGDMNFGSNTDSVAHWGKVGNFRKYNPAVGAGTGSAYKRTYNGSAGESKVAIGINGTSVDVSGLFADGATVYNWYDGKSATVSGGKVTFNGGTTSKPILVSDKNPSDFGVTF